MNRVANFKKINKFKDFILMNKHFWQLMIDNFKFLRQKIMFFKIPIQQGKSC